MRKITDKLQSTDQVQGFSHDSLNRLTSAYAEGGSGGTYASSSSPQLYAYDSRGRLDEKAGVSLDYAATPTGTCHTTSTYPNRNATIPHAVSSADTDDFTYDCSGNMITRDTSAGTQTLVYDAENHLVEVIIGSTTIAEYTYDGDGARVMAIIYDGNDTITTRYYGNYLETIETYSGGVTVSNSIKYYYTGATRIAMRTNDSPVQYLLTDHLGSTSLVVTTSGTIVAQNRYMPWGEVRYSIGTMPTDYTYTGQKNAPEIGLMFYNARWYDPAIAHFTQADSLIPGAGSSQAWDRYAYVFNNPMIYTDPSGHHKITVNSSWECGPDGALCSNGSINHQHSPDKVDEGTLSQANEKIIFSGEMMYELYQNFWKEFYVDKDSTGRLQNDFDFNGMFTVFDFLIMILSYEFSPINNSAIDKKFVSDLSDAGTNWYGCSPDGNTNTCSYAPRDSSSDSSILNWLGGLESARRRYGQDLKTISTTEPNNYLALVVGNAMLTPYDSTWVYSTLNIAKWGNFSLFSNNAIFGLDEEIIKGLSNKQTGIVNYYGLVGTDRFFIMTPNQYIYWKGK